jgi:hypothetical protein
MTKNKNSTSLPYGVVTDYTKLLYHHLHDNLCYTATITREKMFRKRKNEIIFNFFSSLSLGTYSPTLFNFYRHIPIPAQELNFFNSSLLSIAIGKNLNSLGNF